MKITSYSSISKEEVQNRQRNIFIPICLGNKFFYIDGALTQNIKDYLDWALENTKEKVLFVIVDIL